MVASWTCVPTCIDEFPKDPVQSTLPQKESGTRSLAKSDEKIHRSIRKSDQKVTNRVPKTKKVDRTPCTDLLLRHPEFREEKTT